MRRRKKRFMARIPFTGQSISKTIFHDWEKLTFKNKYISSWWIASRYVKILYIYIFLKVNFSQMDVKKNMLRDLLTCKGEPWKVCFVISKPTWFVKVKWSQTRFLLVFWTPVVRKNVLWDLLTCKGDPSNDMFVLFSQNQYGLISHAISSWWTTPRYVKIICAHTSFILYVEAFLSTSKKGGHVDIW